jgi:branched-chain amino acid aminotransferase
MLLPMDDHLAHRGDGVFEALKCVAGNLYNLQGHLNRLLRSAQGVFLKIPLTGDELTAAILATTQAGGRRDCMVRIFVSRGPGGFSVDPYESPAPQVYVVVTAAGRPLMELHPRGARVRTSAVPAKSGGWATLKTCNYLPNVQMRKEAVDAGVDFSVGFSAEGFLTEGASENAGIVSADRRLLFPRLETILAGTTMLRVMALAREVVASGGLASVTFADIRRDAILSAAEMLIAGTTVNLAAAVEYDGHSIGAGQPGPVFRRLSELLERDMRQNRDLLTPVW